jgi:hypothetical protein
MGRRSETPFRPLFFSTLLGIVTLGCNEPVGSVEFPTTNDTGATSSGPGTSAEEDGSADGSGEDSSTEDTGPWCGNGIAEEGELCDGTDVAGQNCQMQGFESGILGCNETCDGYDTSQCITCGDGVVGPGEDCEGDEVGNATCADAGFEQGDLACGADCKFDTTDCYTCGDGVLGGAEACDCGEADSECSEEQVGGLSCADFTNPDGEPFVGGTLGCKSPGDCTHDVSTCIYCGDGVRDETEGCDGSDLGGDTCETLGWLGGGTLACQASCTPDESDCVGPRCGSLYPGDPASCPAVCNGGCGGGICRIRCGGSASDCVQSTIDCPAGWPCDILCDGFDGCDGATFNCADEVCSLACEHSFTCDGTSLNCGVQTCTATCSFASGAPQVECGSSCDCSGTPTGC